MKQVLSYDKRLYSRRTVLAAVCAFRQTVQMEMLSDTAFAYRVAIRCKNEPEQLIGAFNNYMICLENQSGLGLFRYKE